MIKENKGQGYYYSENKRREQGTFEFQTQAHYQQATHPTKMFHGIIFFKLYVILASKR